MADLQKALEWAKNNPGDERSIKLLDAVASGKITSDSVKAKTIQQEQDSVQKSLKDMSFMEKEFSSQGKGIGANLSLGATKGLLSTVQGLADIGEKTFGRIGGAIAEKITGKKAPAQTFEIPEYIRKAEGTAQSIGKGAEQIGEFFIPSSWAAKGVKVAEAGIGATKLAQSTSKLAKLAIGTEKLAARSGIAALEAGTGVYLQSGGDVEKAKSAAKFGAAIPVIGQAIKPLRGGLAKLGEKIETSLIRPTKTDIASGFKTENIFKYNLGGPLPKTAEKTSSLIDDLSNQAKSVLSKNKRQLNLNQAIDAVEEELSKGKDKTFGYNSKIKNAIEHFRNEINSVSPRGIVDIPTANTIKRQVGQFGAWKFGIRDPESDALETVANKLYTKLRLGIEEAAPEISVINKQLSELIPIENAIIRRIPVAERANIVSLSDVTSAIPGLIGNISNWGLFLLNKLSKSGNVANVLNKLKIKDQKGVINTIIYGGNNKKLTPQQQKAANAIRDYLNKPKMGMIIEDVSKKGNPAVGKTANPLIQEARKVAGKEVKMVPVESLPPRATAVAMSEKNFNVMAESIKKDGIKTPLIIDKKTGRVLDGQRRAFVAQKLGIKEVPAVYVDQSRHSWESVQALNKKMTKEVSQPLKEGVKQFSKSEIKSGMRDEVRSGLKSAIASLEKKMESASLPVYQKLSLKLETAKKALKRVEAKSFTIQQYHRLMEFIKLNK